ncbi:RCC1 domain-containing protein [Brumimicrobium oceani]|uniref:Uncharacterized protein n=1 Tax=Brumimicrobium oceani TaxID=2100725 RepID=A0A2U2XG54_9FLAO|nr:T9SS type A sorting domain-containing protein [Brumimicrobium oceani]PWH86737.1 hypothetical protein DIT68_00280 [Brumimicrobium oceani]
MKKILLLKFILFSSLIVSAQCYETLTFGGSHTIGQKPDGTLWGWGLGANGQLMTTNTVEAHPIQLGVATDWSTIENGTENTFVIKNDGTLWGCGRNLYGNLGINSTTLTNTIFQQITTANNWVKVSASAYFTLALKSDGTIWAWGQNNEYQLGNSPATPEQLSPIQVGTDTDWVEIAAGTSSTSFAIKSDGTIWGWGSNPSSIIVMGSSTYTVATPTQVGTDTDWLSMSVGSQHILAQKQDSTLWSWGGGVGLGAGGAPTVTNTPQQISSDKWIYFSAGTNTSFGIQENGTLWVWGVNINGQLGDGTSTDRLVPTQIGNDTNWSTVQAGKFATTMATKIDGTVWYWGGTNYYGQYGNGLSYGTAYYNTPTQTQGICVTSITSGGPNYTTSTIGGVTGSDASGVGTSVGDSVTLVGVVHCQNFSNTGYDITLIDANNDGITLYSSTDINGYIPTEGDEIEVEGVIAQVNGLIQIKPDNINVLQQGATLQSPTLTTVLDETTESQLVRLENLELINGEAMWPTDGNIEVSNTVDTFTVRVTATSTLAGTPTPGTYFHLTGLGKQDDASSPFDSGYQIYPCGVDPYCDIDNSTTLNNGTISVVDTGHSYQWINCADSSAIAGETGETFTPTANGDYAVIITQGPCVDTSACVFVDVLGLEEDELKGISVYPNPITDELNVNNENGALISVEMIDAKGSVIVSSQVESKEIKLNTSDLKPGVYVLVLRSEKGVRMIKVVK